MTVLLVASPVVATATVAHATSASTPTPTTAPTATTATPTPTITVPTTALVRTAPATTSVAKKAAKKAAKKKPAKKLSPKAKHKRALKKAAKRHRAKPKKIAHARVETKYGWSHRQWRCLSALWSRESGWRVRADNPYSSAYGIPQALPGHKMGPGWRTSARAQISWGLRYIDGRYGTPCAADRHQRNRHWY